MAAGAWFFSGLAIRFIQPSFVVRRRSIVGDADLLGPVLVERLLLASSGPSDALRVLVFAHAGLPYHATNRLPPNLFQHPLVRGSGCGACKPASNREGPVTGAHNRFLEREDVSRGYPGSEQRVTT
jgi:hypothetical protein